MTPTDAPFILQITQIPAIDTLLTAIKPNRPSFALDAYISTCRLYDIDPFDAADLDDNPHIIRARNSLFSLDHTEYAPYDYYTDSCLDELTLILDCDRYSDNDEFALQHRIIEFCYDSNDYDLADQLTSLIP
jgi:hypothetical protein